jgi:hypothetical protein
MYKDLGILSALIIYTNIIAQNQVQSLQEYSGQNRTVSIGISGYLVASSGIITLYALILAQLRQRRIRSIRRENNQRLMCTRPLRSWRNDTPQDQDLQPILELERYLLEPGLLQEGLSDS